jgi:hypothetical protein
MGFFDRFTSKKPDRVAAQASDAPAQPVQPAAQPASPSEDVPAPAPTVPSGGVKPRLIAAREKLDMNDLPGAMAIYEEVLASSGDRADVLVTISGDLGATGHVGEIVELIAPRYDAVRHGPATGINLLQAYLAVRDVDAAQHVLDILFSLNRSELEERLHGFSNAIAELMTQPEQPAMDSGAPAAAPAPDGAVPKVALVSFSKPIWFYGLEPMAAQLLPPKEGRLRRVAFAQLATPGVADVLGAMTQPEDELGRLSRALPLWFAETFYFSANYLPIAALGHFTPPGATPRPMVFGAEWTIDNMRQLVNTTQGGLDYIFSGSLRVTAGDFELVLRLHEVKSYRERKKVVARWTPSTADAELAQVHAELRRFMEWSPASASLVYAAPAKPTTWLHTLGASAGLFQAEKSVIGREFLRPADADLEHAARHAAESESASLAYLTLAARAKRLGLGQPPAATLAPSALVQQAEVLADAKTS